MKQFEYKVEWMHSNPYELQHQLKKLGIDGWELVSTRGEHYCILKREIIKKDGI